MNQKIEPNKTKFWSTYGDTKVEWTVKKSRGDDVWECTVGNDDADYAGTVRVFSGEDIRRSLRASAHFAKARRNNDDFYKNLKPGTILHYNDSGRRFVRTMAVETKDGVELKAIALIGDWTWEIGKWNDNGSYSKPGYWPTKIETGETFRVHESTLYELNVEKFAQRGLDIDPTHAEPFDMHVKEPTEDQRNAAHYLRIMENVREMIKLPGGVTNFAAEYKEILENIHQYIGNSLENAPNTSNYDDGSKIEAKRPC